MRHVGNGGFLRKFLQGHERVVGNITGALKPAAPIDLWRFQRFNLGPNDAARGNQVGDDTLIDLQVALVFTGIADFMALCEHTPDFRPEAEGMRQHLEDDVSVARPVAVPAQRGVAEGMRRVVAEVEAAFKREGRVSRVLEARAPRAKQAGELGAVGRLGTQRLARTGQILKRRRPVRPR